jgi:SOS-response transcriptional repressor LexA
MVLPFRGRVSCGSGAEPENCEEEIDLRDYLKVGDSAVFRASGESMIDAQIASGDLLIVSEDPDPPVGSVVVALVGEEMVCKQLARKTSKTVHLKPCSGDQKPLILDTRQNDVQILGVLRNVVRKV